MASSSSNLKSISESLRQIDAKRSSLKKAFDDLQSQQSSFVASFSLTWSDLDSHFAAIKASLELQFRDLQTLAESPAAEPRSELVAICERSDGLGLRRYVSETASGRGAVREELPVAMRRSPDAAAMVLDAMGGFFGEGESEGDEDLGLSNLRRSCVLLLEVLMAVGASVGEEVRERAKALAAEWRRKMSADEESPLEALGFLHLVAAFGLGPEFGDGDIVDCFVVVAKYRQAVDLCRRIGLGDKVGDLVQKLVSKGKLILATKFCFEFGLSEKFPPVPLLKAYLKEAKRIAKKVCKDGNNSTKALNEATSKEVSALRLVLKIIEERKLESEYPPEFLENRIKQLEKQRADRKRPAPNIHSPKPSHPQNPQKHQKGNKRPRTDTPLGHNLGLKNFRAANFSAPSFPHSHLQMRGRSADGSAPYPSSLGPPYGAQGLVPSSGIYGLAPGTHFGVPGNASVASSQYNAEPYTPPSYYDRPTSYGGYGLPPQQYPAAYYPQ